MRTTIHLSILALAATLTAGGTAMAAAMTPVKNPKKQPAATYSYTGPRIELGPYQYRCTLIAHVDGMPGQGFQGMSVAGTHVASLQNTGICNLSTFDGTRFSQYASYKLACNDPVNHSNVASFGIEKADAADPMPVLYVSQCARQPYKGRKDVCFVERLGTDKSTTVQTIFFADVDHLFGYALQWTVDRQNALLVGYGNTINNDDARNRHAVIVFRLPRLADGADITLTRSQAIDFFYLEDTLNRNLNPLIGQGLAVHNGRLFMPTGLGTAERPSNMYVVNLATHRLENVVDMTKSTSGELEDCDITDDGTMLLQTVKGDIYKVEFP